MIEDIVKFSSGGVDLLGIHHRPETEPARRTGVLLCIAGLTYHVGLSRLYVRLARKLAADGYHVLRFDPHGVGDSGGALEKTIVTDLFRDVEKGEFVDDTLAALDFLTEQAGVTRAVLAGFCGGAVTSVLAAPRRMDKVEGLALAGPTIFLHGKEQEGESPLTGESARALRVGYLSKLLSPSAWIRLLTLRTDYKQLVLSFVQPYLKRKRLASLDDLAKEHPNFNMAMAEAYIEVAEKNKPVLFAFGERSQERTEFEEIFTPSVLGPSSPYRHSYTYETIKGGDHNFVFPEAQTGIIESISDWIRKNAD